jgi:hypothetical protein
LISIKLIDAVHIWVNRHVNTCLLYGWLPTVPQQALCLHLLVVPWPSMKPVDTGSLMDMFHMSIPHSKQWPCAQVR